MSEFSQRSAELERVIAGERESNAKLEKEKANLMEEFNMKCEKFTGTIAEQANQVEVLKQKLKLLVEETAKCHEDLETKSKEHQVFLEEMERERSRTRNELEARGVELTQKVGHRFIDLIDLFIYSYNNVQSGELFKLKFIYSQPILIYIYMINLSNILHE